MVSCDDFGYVKISVILVTGVPDDETDVLFLGEHDCFAKIGRLACVDGIYDHVAECAGLVPRGEGITGFICNSRRHN